MLLHSTHKQKLRRLLAVAGAVTLAVVLMAAGFVFSLSHHIKNQKPSFRAYKLGQYLAPLPPMLAEGVCELNDPSNLPICLRGYFRKRLDGPLLGAPPKPCQGQSPALARACSEVQGIRLVETGISRPLAVCEQMPDPHSCAVYVGREAFVRGGFDMDPKHSARAICATGQGIMLALCRIGASKEAVERYGPKIVAAAGKFCRLHDEERCYTAIGRSLKAAIGVPAALKACETLPPLGAAYCMEAAKQ